jgi:LacI family transcriptional regulator
LEGAQHLAATIKDVALRAGVTIGTVSRAFNDYMDIKLETKERIIQAARDLNYTPNVSARSLSAKKPPNIGLIISGLLDGDIRDNSVYLILQGVFKYALSNQLVVALYTTDSKEQRSHTFTQFCKEHSLSGAILSGITTDDVYLTDLIDSQIPSVAIDVPISSGTSAWVSIDNTAATAEMAQYLIKNGHKNIIIVGGKENTAVNTARLTGVRKAFNQAGIPFSEDSIISCDFNEDIAYQKVRAYLDVCDRTDVTAFLCFSDIMAIGVMRAVQDSGYSVPDDFSVTGFDDLAVCNFITPSLTTISQDMRQIGYECASLVHDIIQGNAVSSHHLLPHRLIERNSVKMISCQ